MRCSQCGMPLSPSRTNCPRCGFEAGGASKPDTHNGAAAPQGQWSGPTPPWATHMDPGTPGAPPMQQLSFPGGNSDFAPARNADGSLYTQTPGNNDPRFAPSTPQPTMQPTQWPAAGQFNPPLANNARMTHPLPQRPSPPVMNKRSTRTGFTIASLCLVAGALLLVFVYVLSQSLLGPSTAQKTAVTSTQGTTTTAGTAASKSTSTVHTTVTVATTPTALLAQKYIVQAQMASIVNEQTAIPSLLNTAFHVKQKTYLAMTVNPQGQPGAICLQWYINSQHLTDFDFSFLINPNSQHAFSYIYPSIAGPAYVEIYWASTRQCTDQALAQRVDFTVTA